MTVEVTIKAEREDKNEKLRERNGREKGTGGEREQQQGEIKTIFQLSEMMTGAWYLVADTDVKIHPLSRTEFYISYRKRSRPPRVALPAAKGLSGIAPWSYTSGQSLGKSSASSAPPRREDKENERTQISNRIISNLAILGPHNTSSPFLKQKGFGKTIYKSPIRTPATPRSNLRNTFTPTSAEPPSSPGSGSKRKRGAAANEPPFSPYEKKECEPLSSTAPVPPPPPPVSHVPPPPPAPPVAGEEKSKPKRKKMRPLHWNSIPKVLPYPPQPSSLYLVSLTPLVFILEPIRLHHMGGIYTCRQSIHRAGRIGSGIDLFAVSCGLTHDEGREEEDGKRRARRQIHLSPQLAACK